MRGGVRAVAACWFGAFAAMAACNDPPGIVAIDSGSQDAPGDAPMQADGTLSDGAVAADGPLLDATLEAAAEAGVDATTDAPSEASDGAPVDAAPTDAGVDAPADAPSDALDGGAADASDGAPQDASDGGAEDAFDGSPQDAGEVGPPSLCPGSTFLFCDGFEQSLLTNWSAIASTGGQAGIDTIHAYRGARALHSDVYAMLEAGTNASAYVQKYPAQPWPTHSFTRMFAYMPSPGPSHTFNLLDLMQNGGSYSGLELRVEADGSLAMVTFSTSANQSWQSTTSTFPLDQWVCFELEVDTVAETTRVYMNDSEVTDLAHGNLAMPQIGITSVGLGFVQAGPQSAYDVWIDEVVVDSARIGCSN